jgi:hypothetical protein
MSKRAISWILDYTDKLKTKEERIDCLRQNDSEPMRIILKYALDPNIEWLLPEGDPPYKPETEDGLESRLYSQARTLYLFVKGGNDNLLQLRREYLFVNLLETIHPEDAKLLLAVKDKKLPYKNINAKLIKEVYPGLL